jgi:glutamate-1-semialdehyde 2,1-aminomutase
VSILDEYTRLHPASAALYQESLQTFPSGVTHDVRFLQPFPVYVDRANGSRKWDVDGIEYVDYVMGHGALFMGHAHPEITAAVIEQAQKGTHYGANHRLELEWGKLVRQIVPSAEEVRFTSSGTEATLMAIRLARAYTGRDKILKFDHHFHGWHDAVVGARSPEDEHPHSAGVPSGTAGNTISVPQNDIALVEEKLAPGEVAAVILEPTGASWGTLPLQEGFLAQLRDATRRHSTVLIFDEVVTGFRCPGRPQELRCAPTSPRARSSPWLPAACRRQGGHRLHAEIRNDPPGTPNDGSARHLQRESSAAAARPCLASSPRANTTATPTLNTAYRR